MLVEVKSSASAPLFKALRHFHTTLQTDHAFQAAFDLPDQSVDDFQADQPVIVPVQSLLSQLV